MITVPPQQGRSKLGVVLLVALIASPVMAVIAAVMAIVVFFVAIIGNQPPAAAANCGSVSTVVDQGSNVKTAWVYLRSVGMSPQQAAGVIGNLQQESSPALDPRADNGVGFLGIAQWSGSRWAVENQFATDLHADQWGLGLQLRFLAWELGLNNEWAGHAAPFRAVGQALVATTDVAGATTVIFERFEAPGDSTLPARKANAQRVFDRFNATSPSGAAVVETTRPSATSTHPLIVPVLALRTSPSASPVGTDPAASTTPSGPSAAPAPVDGCATGGGNVQALITTLTQWAWPTWQGVDHLERRPAYAAAVTHAIDTGHYFGYHVSGRPDGDDCGVFVSLLLTMSGFDPTYNHGGVLSAGAGNSGVQMAWAQAHMQPLGTASNLNESDLRPGDVGISASGGFNHVWIYVGKVPGFNGTFAEASQVWGTHQGYAPQARINSNAPNALYADKAGAEYFRPKVTPAAGGAGTPAACGSGWYSAATPDGTITYPGQCWFGGRGVDIHANGGDSVHTVWQCTELARRFWWTMGWAPRTWRGGVGKTLWSYQPPPGSIAEPQGRITQLSAGDILSMNITHDGFDTPLGHVGVINAITRNGSGFDVEMMSQNTPTAIWHFTWDGTGSISMPSSSSYSASVTGVLHHQ